jgi:predicted TIM-barrel fold metal-dependent hydrolase
MERRLITSDCHIAPPYSLVEELPESYREHFPRIEQRQDGLYIKMPKHAPFRTKEVTMGMTPQSDPDFRVQDDPHALARAAVVNACPDAQPSFDPAETLADLERDGVYGAVLIGRASATRGDLPPEVDVAYSRLVNDWLADTWSSYLDRVAPGFFLPYDDVSASVRELERAASMGLRPALLPDGLFARPYYLPEWEPLWEAANSLKVPITMHIGNTRNPPKADWKPFPGAVDVGWYNECVAMGETLGWLTYAGVFERYPDLHVVMTEGYAAWLAFAIQFFDHHWSDSRLHDLPVSSALGEPKIDAPPSVYLKRQAHATFMWDPLAIRTRDVTGTDCLLWGNDYPHHEGSFPFSHQWIEKQFAGVPEPDIDALVSGNAARIFGIEI